MIDPNLLSEVTLTGLSVIEILKKYPALPPKVVVALAVVFMLERTVTPFRLCECGCGASVHGKARLASLACRKRVSRQRRALAATGPKQFGLVLQSEIPVRIPATPPPRSEVTAVPVSKAVPPAFDEEGKQFMGETLPPSQRIKPDTDCVHDCCGCEANGKPRGQRPVCFVSHRMVGGEDDAPDIRVEIKSDKLALIRDLSQLGRTVEQISQANSK